MRRAPWPQRVPPPLARFGLSTGVQARHRLADQFYAAHVGPRALTLEEEISEIDAILKPLVKKTAAELVATLGIGADAASALLVAAGDNPGRLRNEAAFAHLCGASRSMRAAARTSGTASAAAVIARPTRPCGTS